MPFTIKVRGCGRERFALPGGFFYVNFGLILGADKERNWRA